MNCSIQFSKTIYVRMDLRNIYRYRYISISHTHRNQFRLCFMNEAQWTDWNILIFPLWGLKCVWYPMWTLMDICIRQCGCGWSFGSGWKETLSSNWSVAETRILKRLLEPPPHPKREKRECFKTTYCSRSLKYLQKNQTKTPIINRGLWSVISGVGASITDD